MSLVRRLTGTSVLITAATAWVLAQDPQTFRAGTSIVTVETAVLDGKKLVRGLTAKDFVIEDNGVRQQIELVDVESLPVDLTIVVDVSGSMTSMLDEIRVYVRDASSVLRADDRIRVLTFAGEIQQLMPLQAATADVPLEQITIRGATAIYDALIASLMRTRGGDRRHLVVAFTDGDDSNSAMSIPDLKAVAQRSDSVLDLFIVRDVMMTMQQMPHRYLNTRGYALTRMEHDMEGLSDAARATGGYLTDVAARPQLPAMLKATLEDFRTSYVLRYRPTGVPADGWHTIGVRVPSGSYTVRARTGYYAGK